MKTFAVRYAFALVVVLTTGCTTHRLNGDDLRLSTGDMQAIRQLISSDPELPSHWLLNHASYHMMSSGMEPAQVWTNSLSASLIDTNSLRGVTVTFRRDRQGEWKRTEIQRTVRQTPFVGDIPYDVGEAIVETLLLFPAAMSNELDYVQRIYAIPEDSPHRGPELSTWMSNWERWPSQAEYLVNLYRASSFADPPDDWDKNETYAEAFVKMTNNQAQVLHFDMLSPAIEATRYHGQWIAQLVFDLWSARKSDGIEADRRLVSLVAGGCTSDKLAKRLVRDSPFLQRSDANDGWGRPFRLKLESTHGSLRVQSAGANGLFGDADDMERTWDFGSLRARQLEEIAEQDESTVPVKAAPSASSPVR